MNYLNAYDVIVVGGGPGGFPAAIAASRRGLSVLIIERNSYLGGLLSAGIPPLAFHDRAGNPVVGGIAQELVTRLSARGAASEHMPVPIQNCMTMLSAPWVRIETLEMCIEAGVHVLFYADIWNVCVSNERITGLDVLCKGTHLHFDSKYIIDASGDGVVVANSGAEYMKETTLQPPTLIFHLGNVNLNEAKNYLREHPESYKLPATFPGIEQNIDITDKREQWCIMAYFDLIKLAKERGEFDVPRDMIDFVVTLNPGEVIMNVTRAPGTDTSDYQSATEAEITCNHQVIQVFNFMRKYVPGFENCVINSMAPCVGPRESRKIVGKKCLTKAALKNLDIPDDTIALCGYNVDIHGANTSVDKHESTSINMSITPIDHAIGIPFGCLIPISKKGLLVSGRLICVDQIIYGMTRIMPTCMAVGEAAGIAVSIAIKNDIEVEDVNIATVQQEIVLSGGYISL